jgi:general secretion pathway protein D
MGREGQRGFVRMRERFAEKFGTVNHFGTPVAARKGSQSRETEHMTMPPFVVSPISVSPFAVFWSRMNRRNPAQAAVQTMASRWRLVLALLAAAAGLGLPAARLHAESATSDFKQGQAAEAREDYDTAFELYQKAYARDPKDARFRISLARIRVTASSLHITKGRKLLQAGDLQGALSEFLHAAEIDPGNEAAQQEIARVRQRQGTSAAAPEVGLPQPPGEEQELDQVEAPPELHPITSEPLSLHMAEDAKVVYQAVARAAGVNVLFDPDFNSKRIQVDLNNVSLLDALRIVGVMSDTFWRPVTSNTIFVAQNSRNKRQELDEQAVQTFYLTNAWQQNDLNDVQTALRNVMPNAKVYGVQSQNAIVMRATPDELLLAQQLIDDLDKARGEVVVDIAVLEVSKNWERTLGISWPSSIGVALQPNCSATNSCSTSGTAASGTGTGTTTTSPTLYTLAHLNSTDFAMTVGSATLNLLLTDNNTKVLQSPRIRATDDQKATMKIGSRIPIATGSYQTGAATALVSSLVNTQFQYQDVGVNIEMTPSVHYDHDVTLKIKIEVSAESGTETISGVTEPIISQRVVDQTIRLREGEASILGGIQNKQEENNWAGIPGLSAIPVLKYIFGSRDRQIQDDDIVFVVVPHIVRSQELDQANLRVIDTGSGQSIDLRHADSGGAPAAPPAPTVQPAAMNQPAVGTVPAQSAIEAAPAMLAQLRSDMASSGGPQPAAQATVQQPPAKQPAAQQPAAAPAPAPQPSAPPPTQPAAPVVSPAAPSQAPAVAPPAPVTASPSAPPAAATGAAFALNAPTAPPASGATFQVPVVLNGATDVASIALQFHYDAAKLQLVNVSGGDFLSRDGQAAPPIHTDQPAGNLVVGISRPPGTHGVTGTGVVCVLTFQAKAPGPSDLSIARASVVNSAQQQMPATSAQTSIVVK